MFSFKTNSEFSGKNSILFLRSLSTEEVSGNSVKLIFTLPKKRPSSNCDLEISISSLASLEVNPESISESVRFLAVSKKLFEETKA